MAGLLNMTPQQVAKAQKPKRLTGNYYAGGKQSAFIEQVMPHALRFAEQTGLDPRLAIATSALETGWGKHAPGGALFGIKGGGQDLMTTEFVDGKPVQMKQSFRRYDAAQDPAAASFDDFANLIAKSKDYGNLRAMAGKPFDEQVAAFTASPYATEPADPYFEKDKQTGKMIRKQGRRATLQSIGNRIYLPDVAKSQVSQQANNGNGVRSFIKSLEMKNLTPGEVAEILKKSDLSAYEAAMRSQNPSKAVYDLMMGDVYGKAAQEPAVQHDVPLEQQDWVHRPALDTGEGYKPGLLQSAFNTALGISNAYGQDQQEPQTMAQRKSPWQQRVEFLEQAERERKQNAGGLLDVAQQPIMLDMPAATPAASPAAGDGILQGLNPDITQEQINAQLGYPQPGEPIPTRELASYGVVPPQPVQSSQGPAQAATAPISSQAAMMQHPQLPPAQQPQNGLQRYAQGLLGNQAALGLISGGLLQAFGAKPQEAQQFGGQLAQTLTQQRERQQQRDAVAALVRQAGGSDEDIALAYASPLVTLDMLQKRQAAMAPKSPETVVNVGGQGALLDYDTKTGQAVIADPSAPGGLRVAQIAGGQKAIENEKALATAENMLGTIDGILKDPAAKWAVGVSGIGAGALQNLGLGALAPGAARARGRMDQIQGQVYLRAYETLKGGGQITEFEGRKARDAIARLNETQSWEDYQDALRELRDVTQAAIERIKKHSSSQSSSGVQDRPEFERKKQQPQATEFEGWSMQEVAQ